jgi:hypothetical protein
MTQVAAHIVGLSSLALTMHEQIKGLIDHTGEKGRSSEHVVRAMLRAVLPKQFSIGTGIIVSSHNEKSRQTDIVVFDDFLNASPSLIGEVGIFPIECVYAALEVKSWINSEAIRQCAEAIGLIRRMKDHKYYRVPVLEITAENTFKNSYQILQNTVAPRTYLFAFDTEYSTIGSLIDALARHAVSYGAHFHGVVVLSKNWFIKQRPFQDSPKFKFTETEGVKHFSHEIIVGINDFEMYPAAMEKYLNVPALTEWQG